jgi:S1-C subfamily serine protease
MTDATSPLVQFSDALAALAQGARGFVAQVAPSAGRPVSGVLWNANTVVVSEQALCDAPEYDVTVGDRTAKAAVAGRDDGTNIAILKLKGDLPHALPQAARAKLGGLVVVLGASALGTTSRLALVRALGGEWQSLAGGSIDERIVLDARLGSEEGGPVLAADGGFLGISTHGARRQSLVIPAATIARAVDGLLEKGRVERGWLGIAVRPVILPEALRAEPGQRIGLMVMDVSTDGPGAKAGILPGDVLITIDSKPATRLRDITRQLGPSSIGKSLPLSLARAGTTVAATAVIEARR